jgi:M6 family metalloprotease-like protein
MLRGLKRGALWAVMTVTLAAAVSAGARPMMNEEVSIREPDGTYITLRVWGDEYYGVGETPDGFTVTRDPVTGFMSYATLSSDGTRLQSTGVRVGDAPPAGLRKHIRIDAESAREQALAAREAFERSEYGAPLSELGRLSRSRTVGSVVGITLIIDFSDDPATIPAGNVDDYCNLFGYTGYSNNGSVRDYFYDVSDGLLDYTNFVPDAYYRAENPKSYYTDPGVPYGARAEELITEAMDALDDAGFDFSLYDSNGDNIIDALNCFYAGDVWNSWGEGLWPHSGGMSYSADGVHTWRYQITDMSSSLALGTFCHENGHMLMGWPDLYDYDYDSTGVGAFCLMCYGAYDRNPVEPCAYMKYDAGWGDVTELVLPQAGLPAPGDGNTMFRFTNPSNAREYYLVENRQRSGRDINLPDDGLAIWHVDEDGNNSYQQQTPAFHYLVTLVQADGDWDFEHNRNYGDGNDLYHATQYPSCTPISDPNTDWWDGSESGASFADISSSSSVMSFDFLNASYMLELATAAYASEIGHSETATYLATLHNWAGATDTATVEVGHDALPPGVDPTDWQASYRIDGGAWETGPTQVVLSADETVDVEVRVVDTVGTTPGMALTTFSAMSGISALVSTESFATFVDAPSILIVDDDNGGTDDTYLATALADTGYGSVTYDVDAGGRPTANRLASYSIVMWSTGSGNTNYITADDEQRVMEYLDAGGSLLFSSQDYLSARSATTTFISDYLHVDSWTDDTSGFAVTGVGGDPITDGMFIYLASGPFSANYSDSFVTDTAADTIFTTAVGTKGLKVEEDGHKLVFLSFPFENLDVSAASPNNQRTVIARVVEWFAGSSTGVGDGETGHRLALGQNVPNPFNPVTKISFTVPAGAERVSLIVYDVAGRLVRTLVDGSLPAGPNTVSWNGTDASGRHLSSGVYFARLSTGGESVLSKMTLLK